MVQNCPNVISNGTCSDNLCPFIHNVITCQPCRLTFAETTVYEKHVASPNHHKKIAKMKTQNTPAGSHYHCPVCIVNICGEIQWEQHIRGTKHHAQAATKRVSPDVQPVEARQTATNTFCELCNTIVPLSHWDQHILTRAHQSRIHFASYHKALQAAEMDRGGVSIVGSFDFAFVNPPASVSRDFSITVSEANAKVVLQEVKLASKQGSIVGSSPGFSLLAIRTGVLVTPSSPTSFKIQFNNAFIGRYEDRVEFLFKDKRLKQSFVIVRIVKAVVGDEELHHQLRATAPYVPRERSDRQIISDVIQGVKPPANTAIRYVGKLPKAPIPDYLTRVLDNETMSTGKRLAEIQKIMPPVFDTASYGRHFKLLLWVEEQKMERDLERYDIVNATLQKHNKYYYLEVPGLAEKRPSVLIGDRILVQEQGSTNGKWYEGHVHVVRQIEVGLCFHMNFNALVHYNPSKRFHVRFKLNRIPAQRQHQALDTVFTQSRVFFPQRADLEYLVAHRPAEVPLRLFNRLIETNEPQLQAVAGVMAMQPGSMPFIIFGPPGTGKTITMIECIQQVLATNPQARIFACAPSNSAADLIALRLTDKTVFGELALNNNELFRFYAPSRHKNQCPDKLLDFTCTNSEGMFSVPSDMERIKRFQVIVSTCVSSSFASGIGMPRGHFSHIFVDEAGQATEPEAVLCMKLLGDAQTNFVLSGDPKQLGPIIRSTVAMRLGLEMSFLERLMQREAYDLTTGRDYCVVKLTKNFRSHAAILKFPNERFYAAELEPCADAKVIDSFLGSAYLPNPKFPIVFHAVSGKDDREASSPSFFNVDEIAQIKAYVARLKEDRKYRTTDNDIGVIAPYHAQTVKLRAALKSVAEGVKVGSVEEFQGQERRVIIISTVRSSRDFIEYDLRHTLGFVANPRRFNVAVTRAQALLIVVGDPQVLSLDPLWRSFLNYVHINGGWTGPDISWDPLEEVNEAGGYDAAIREKAGVDMSEFTRRMEEMTMKEVDDDDDGAGVDKPWRDVE